jgi:SGNH domain (fused to AT3 domains)
VDALHPDVVVMVDRPIDDMTNAPPVISRGRTFQPGDDGFEKALTDESAASIAKLQADGRKLVIIEAIPIAPKDGDPINCLSSASRVDDCIYQANPQPTPLENFYRDEAAQRSVWSSVDLDRLVCPRLPTCDPVVDGTIVKRDSNHITGTFAANIADRVDAILRDDGVL